jgi:hypothetical protein
MSADDKPKGITDIIVAELKPLAVEVYKDAAKSAVTAAGDTLGRLVRLALHPVELLAQGDALHPVELLAQGDERLMSTVERKLSLVPEDRLLPPPATIGAPAVRQYALLGDGDGEAELRETYAVHQSRNGKDSCGCASVPGGRTVTPAFALRRVRVAGTRCSQWLSARVSGLANFTFPDDTPEKGTCRIVPHVCNTHRNFSPGNDIPDLLAPLRPIFAAVHLDHKYVPWSWACDVNDDDRPSND